MYDHPACLGYVNVKDSLSVHLARAGFGSQRRDEPGFFEDVGWSISWSAGRVFFLRVLAPWRLARQLRLHVRGT